MANVSAQPVFSGKLLLGVDGGGSKTAAWVANQESTGCSTVLGRGVAGASNPRAVGVAAAADAVVLAVERAFSDANLPPQPAAVAVLAIAGAAEASVSEQLHAELSKALIAKEIHVVTDASPLFAVGTPNGWGIVLIAGTGSVAFGQNSQGQTGTAGGFGYLLGDEGSGYWLGREALAAVTASIDGRQDRTTLSHAIFNQLQVKDSRGIKDAVYGAVDPRNQIAALAPLVIQCAEAGDAVATEIVSNSAVELAKLVASVAEQIGLLNSPFPLALSGSVLCKSERMHDEVLHKIAAIGCQADPITMVANPVEGCLQLTAKKLGPSA